MTLLGPRLLGCLLAFAMAGCAAVADDMRRAQVAFDEARYEDVEVWLAALQRDVPEMDVATRTRFYYLRGTTAFRLHQRDDARHYLALAREELAEDVTALKTPWRRDLADMLETLSEPEDSGGEVPDEG